MSNIIEEFERLEGLSISNRNNQDSSYNDHRLHGPPQQKAPPSPPLDTTLSIWDQAKPKLSRVEEEYLKHNLSDNITKNTLLWEEINALEQISKDINYRILSTPKLPTAPERDFIRSQIQYFTKQLKGRPSLGLMSVDEQRILEWCNKEHDDQPRRARSAGNFTRPHMKLDFELKPNPHETLSMSTSVYNYLDVATRKLEEAMSNERALLLAASERIRDSLQVDTSVRKAPTTMELRSLLRKMESISKSSKVRSTSARPRRKNLKRLKPIKASSSSSSGQSRGHTPGKHSLNKKRLSGKRHTKTKGGMSWKRHEASKKRTKPIEGKHPGDTSSNVSKTNNHRNRSQKKSNKEKRITHISAPPTKASPPSEVDCKGSMLNSLENPLVFETIAGILPLKPSLNQSSEDSEEQKTNIVINRPKKIVRTYGRAVQLTKVAWRQKTPPLKSVSQAGTIRQPTPPKNKRSSKPFAYNGRRSIE